MQNTVIARLDQLEAQMPMQEVAQLYQNLNVNGRRQFLQIIETWFTGQADGAGFVHEHKEEW
jgi:hypothetical protein